jgi:surface carbohydrate biosynthesis protein
MKPRVLLHSMTFKRDFGMIYILSKLLEHLGCECIIADNTNVTRPFMRLWKPHAVFFVSLSHTRSVRKAYPNAKLFHLSAEGGSFTAPAEFSILNDEWTIDNMHRFYLWGRGTYDAISSESDRLELRREGIPDIKEKCMIVGSPRMDICRFSDTSKSRSDGAKIRIGLVGNFYYLNHIKFAPLSLLAMHEFANDSIDTAEQLLFQVKLCETYCRLIKTLDRNSYSFSIRPYPLEKMDSYKNFGSFAEINTYLEFTSWLIEQDIIIGSTSTTVSQIAATGKPYINLDAMLDRRDWDFGSILSTGLERQQAKCFDDVLTMINNYQDFKFTNLEMTEKLDYYYNASEKKSVLYRVAKDIFEQIGDPAISSGSILPKSFVLKCIALWSSYIRKRNKKELAADYSYFRLADAEKQAALELGGVINRIILDSEKDKTLES